MDTNKKVAHAIAKNLTHLFVGYYFEKNASEIPKPDQELVARVILPELASANRPKYQVIGTTIFEVGSTLIVFNADNEKLAQEICTAFNTYG